MLACCLSKTCGAADQQGSFVSHSLPRIMSLNNAREVAQAFNQALCAGVNVIVPNFLGCAKSSTSTTFSAPAATVQAEGLEGQVTIPTTAPVVTFNGHKLLTGSCAVAQPVIATLSDGGLLEYPRLGCSDEQPGCCPFNPRVGGILSICPADYTTTDRACCPS